MTCTRCATPAMAGADYCGACGAALRASGERGAVALPHDGTWRRPLAWADRVGADDRHHRWMVRAIAVVAAVIVLELVAGLAQIAPERHEHRTAAKLAATTSALHKTQADLTIRTQERDRFYTEHIKARGELDDAKKSLAFTDTQLATFKECHRLVNEFIGALDAGDQAKAKGLAPQADKACNAADRLL